MSMSDTAIDGIIQRIYNAALDPTCWGRALRETAEAIGATAPGIVLRSLAPADPGHRLTLDAHPTFNEGGYDYYVLFDQGPNVLAGIPPGAVTICTHMLAEPVYLGSEVDNDGMHPRRRRHWIASIVWRDGPLAIGPVFQREEGKPDFAEDEIALLARLVPHFHQALCLHRRLKETEAVYDAQRELTDCLPVGVILVDARGRVLDANRRAETILRRRDGLVQERETLSAAEPGESRALRALLVRDAATGAPGGWLPGDMLRISRPSERRSLQVLVTRLSRDTAPARDSRRPAAAVLVSDPEDGPELIEEHVRRLHGLTAAEARTAVDLAYGLSVREIADRAGVQQNTVRWHLKQIYAKTGTHRQVELVRLVLGMPGVPSLTHSGRVPAQL
jgi:DNA-binding CsgD family transcriptional regulator